MRAARPRVCILHAPGTNRDRDAACAFERAGATPEIVSMRELVASPDRLDPFDIVLIPGGFSYGDDLGAGVIWAAQLRRAGDGALDRFIASGRLVLGICNGFQALVRGGWLPGPGGPRAALTRNAGGGFECRWVTLTPDTACISPVIQALDGPISCPVAHGEGRFVVEDAEALDALKGAGMVALRYQVDDPQQPYPQNPNGAVDHIAGVCNARGNVLGMMPHPEDHILPAHRPDASRGVVGGSGLRLFEATVRVAREIG